MKKIDRNKLKIINLLNENIDLKYNENLKSFRKFIYEVRNIGTKKEPKEVTLKIGCWFEWFKDEDKPLEKGIRIERKCIVAINGEKSDGYKLLEYYSINDI